MLGADDDEEEEGKNPTDQEPNTPGGFNFIFRNDLGNSMMAANVRTEREYIVKGGFLLEDRGKR